MEISVLLLMTFLGCTLAWDILPRFSKYPFFLTLGIPDPILENPNLLADDKSITSGRIRETDLMSQFTRRHKVSSEVFSLSTNRSCFAANSRARKQVEGICTSVYDVVVARRCAGLQIAKARDCPESEVCCYDLSSNPERKVFIQLDRSVCGLRRTSELVTRDLKRSYSGELQVAHRLQRRLLDELTTLNEICWQAAIMIDGKYACSGAIINSQNILTAAHCLQEVDNLSRIRVLIGTSDLSRMGSCSASLSASNVLFDPAYDPQTFARDMAIIKLAKPIDDASCACRICIPSSDTEAQLNSGNPRCISTSYRKAAGGRRSITTERVAVTPNGQCGTQLDLSHALNDVLSNLDTSMLCGVGLGSENATARADKTCSDQDTGSPLACRLDRSSSAYTLVGLTSWG